MDVRANGSLETGEPVVREGSCQLAWTVATEVEEDHRVAVTDGGHRVARVVYDCTGLEEFVCCATGIRSLDRFERRC